jgi:uncharacterized protein (TIGR03067 family)
MKFSIRDLLFVTVKGLSLAILFASFASTAVWGEEPALAGEWRTKSLTLYGKPDPSQVGSIYRFGKDALISFQFAGREAKPAMGVVNFKAKPWTVDIELNDDRREVGGEGAREGIIELKGDVLTICVSAAAKVPRPKKFESKEGEFSVLIVLERVKKCCP